MKSTILNLKKRVLEVEVQIDTVSAIIKDFELYTKIEDDEEFWFQGNVEVQNAKALCKGSELSEDIANTLAVEFKFGKYKIHNKPWYLHTDSALDSFISAIEASNYYWKDNPEKKSNFNPEEFIQKEYERFMEAESKTFHPDRTLIFEIL